MKTSNSTQNKSALITGATSGIGAEYARHFASEGYNLILTGRRKDKLQALADELAKGHGIKTEIVIAELSQPGDVDALVRLIQSRNDITALINNAGFGSGAPFHEDTVDHQIAMVMVHNLAPVRFCHAVLPQMMKNKLGVIINVASLAGWIPNPKDALYPSTKAFLISFSESLFMELKPFGIKVQVNCPGFTWTDFHERMGFEQAELKNHLIVRWMSARDVVQRSIKRLRRNRNPVLVPGFWNKVVRGIVRNMPRRLYYRIFGNAAEILRK